MRLRANLPNRRRCKKTTVSRAQNYY